MAKTKERKFGEIPGWAQRGPIDLKNYNYRAEKHCADRSNVRGGEHPTIALWSPELVLWREYFDRHLGGRPWAFKALLDGTIQSMTLPEEMPEWFDRSFTPMAGWRPADEHSRSPPARPPPAAPVGNYAKYGDYDYGNDDYEFLDGKHAERVAADIAERRKRREQEDDALPDEGAPRPTASRPGPIGGSCPGATAVGSHSGVVKMSQMLEGSI